MGGTHHSNRRLPPNSKAQSGDFDRSRIPRSKFRLVSSNLKQTPKEAKHEQELFTEQFVRNGKPDRTQNPDLKGCARSAIPRIADRCPHHTARGRGPKRRWNFHGGSYEDFGYSIRAGLRGAGRRAVLR